jgi:acyl-coenzyme A synthetase/AMP-(fatty) acid ligase
VIVLSHSSLPSAAYAGRADGICLDTQWEEIRAVEDALLSTALDAGTPAYVMYTSGSTGKPKGVPKQQPPCSGSLSSNQFCCEQGQHVRSQMRS